MAELDIEKLKSCTAIKQIPILTLDERWYHLITDKLKTDEICYWEKQVNELLKKQGQVNNDIKEVKKIKNQLIQDVVDNMQDEDNDPKRAKVMEKNQRLIQEAKDKINSLEDEALDIPRDLVNANERLMIETVKVCYNKINSNKEDLEVLDKWINATRVKLKKNILIKQDKEEVNNRMYSAMHDILGPDVMKELDKVNEVLSSSEQFVEKYQKPLLVTVLIIILVVAGFLSVRHFYFQPREVKAQAAMYKGEIYFAKDSFELALKGNGADFVGFEAIADDYSSTKAGNLAAAYAGICYYNLGKDAEALAYLKKFDGDDAFLSPNIEAMIGNCYANMDQYDDAIKAFEKAAKKADNEMASPIFLQKAATVAEKMGNYKKALDFYQKIKDEYSQSMIGRDIDKYIERAKAHVK